jgi:hopanoid-associated phosphorylase
MKPIIVATGFTREARTIIDTSVVAITGGGVAANLERALNAAAGRGAAGIISYGLTGGLAEGLRIGDWVIGDRLSGAIEMATDPAWTQALHKRLPNARIGGFFADGRMIDTVAEKRALGVRHAALAVDMESHVAAKVAQAHGLPFAIVRIISDEVGHLLPHAITVSMRPDGGLHTAAMLTSLARNPRQIGDVGKTMAAFARGFSGLKAGARALHPRMAFPD